jgi:hypothetical protein
VQWWEWVILVAGIIAALASVYSAVNAWLEKRQTGLRWWLTEERLDDQIGKITVVGFRAIGTPKLLEPEVRVSGDVPHKLPKMPAYMDLSTGMQEVRIEGGPSEMDPEIYVSVYWDTEFERPGFQQGMRLRISTGEIHQLGREKGIWKKVGMGELKKTPPRY